MNSQAILTAWCVGMSLLSGCVHAVEGALKPGATLSAVSEAGVPLKLRIDAVKPDPQDTLGEVLLYDVSFLDETDQQWKALCLPDREGHTTAIPLQGSWNQRGEYRASDALITFACTNGVIAKCVRWGYKPWKTVNGQSLEPFHYACTRMARADYCGNGHGHTRDGTLIDVSDVLGLQKPTASDTLVLEAAWSPDGATYVNRARYAEPLEELFAECPERLKGHTALDLPGLTPEQIRSRWPQTLLFNSSVPKTERP